MGRKRVCPPDLTGLLEAENFFFPLKIRPPEWRPFRKDAISTIEAMPDGKVLIDFNRAYNPFCQFNEKYTCPFAPEENWLDIAIRAGEKRFQ